MDETFRHPRAHRLLGLGFFLGFLAWAGLDLAVTLRDPTIPHRLAFGVLTVGVPLGMAVLSAWLLASACRDELVIRAEWVSQRGVFGTRLVDLGEVHDAHWRCFPGNAGSIVLRSGSIRLAIDLGGYGQAEQPRIVRYLREALPVEVQVGWNFYAYKFPPVDPGSEATKLGPDEVVLRRDHWDRYFAAGLAAACVLGLVTWWNTGDPSRFVGGLVLVALFWVPLRFLTPARGMTTRRLSKSLHPEAVSFLAFLALWFLVALAGVIAHEVYRPKLANPNATLIVGVIAWLAILLREAHRLDRGVARRDRDAAEQAAKARGESLSADFENP